MAARKQARGLSEANILYLYDLLSRTVGTGKQTFSTKIEEALATDRMTAEDLGYESTKALLEAMGACIRLTEFKGGRLYATVVATPQFDQVLKATQNAEPAPNQKGNKPWKRKKGAKALKPQRPRRVKKEEPGGALEPTADPTAPQAMQPAASAAPAATDKVADPVPETPSKETRASAGATAAALDQNPSAQTEPAQTEPAQAPLEAEPDIQTAPEPERISITVTYNPYTGVDEETRLEVDEESLAAARARWQEFNALADDAEGAQCAEEEVPSDPAARIKEPAASKERPAAAPRTPAVEAEPAKAVPAASTPRPEHAQPPTESRASDRPTAPDTEAAPKEPASATGVPATEAPSPAPAPGKEDSADKTQPEADTTCDAAAVRAEDSPAAADQRPLPEDLPISLAEEVFCSGVLLRELTHLYPLGADVMGILGEYYLIARDKDELKATRGKFSFRAKYLDGTNRRTLDVTVRRQPKTSAGLTWAVDDIRITE